MNELSVETLAAAFVDDPVMKFILPSPSVRPVALKFLMRFLIAMGGCEGEVEELGLGKTAAMVSYGAGKFPVPFLKLVLLIIRFSWPALKAGIRLGTIWKAIQLLWFIDPLHPEFPHAYVLIIGVHPTHQGHGHGVRMMEALIVRSDRTGTPIYLESSNVKNIPFYQKIGFEIMNEIHPFKKGPPMWRMLRKPVDKPKA